MIEMSKIYNNIFFKDFATIVYENLKYVSFSEFYDNCIKVATTVVQFVQSNNIQNVVLYIPENLNKSNFWVSLLMYSELIKICTHCIFKISDLNLILDTKESTVFLYPDDCIYSGKQISFNISKLINVYKHLHLDISNTIFIPIVPYICKPTYSKLISDFSDRIYLYIPENTNTFMNMRGYFEKYNYDISNTLNDPDFGLNKSIIYFRHKLADNVSILYLIIRLGYYYTPTKNDFIGSLINYCGSPDETVESLVDNYDLIDNYSECPEPFYKKIDYKFFNYSVNNFETLIQIYYSSKDEKI